MQQDCKSVMKQRGSTASGWLEESFAVTDPNRNGEKRK